MDSQGEDTELELTKIGVNNSGDSLRTDQKANLRADQKAKKKLLEQTKKLSNKLNLTNRNPGLAGREIPFFYLVVLGCSIFLLYTIIQNIILLLQAQNSPASSLSHETATAYPKIALLVCPHFLVNQNVTNVEGTNYRVVPHLEVFQLNAGGSRTSKFTSSEGNEVEGTNFPYIPVDATDSLTKVYEPAPIDMAFYQKTAIGCIMMTPSGVNETINSGTNDLRTSLDQLTMGRDQDQIAQLTVGMYCTVSINGGEPIRDNNACPEHTPLLVSAISTEESDFNKTRGLKWNFQHPCNDSPAKYCAFDLVMLSFVFL